MMHERERQRLRTKFSRENLKGRSNSDYLRVDWKIVQKITEKLWTIHFVQITNRYEPMASKKGRKIS